MSRGNPIDSIAQAIREYRTKYLVLLIITDGEIHDMESTIDRLVSASFLPLSVLIVGVGNDSFQNMKVCQKTGVFCRFWTETTKRFPRTGRRVRGM